MRFIQFFYDRLFWLVPLWYGFTMALTRWRRWPEVKRYIHTREITEAISWGEAWRPDPLKGVLDVMMDPRKFQHRINAGDAGIGDCDDHAIYWATALLKSGLAEKAWIGSAWYGDARGKNSKGHVVCIFQHKGRRFWVDYRDPHLLDTAWSWAYTVALDRGKLLYCAGMVEVLVRGKKSRPKFRIRSSRSMVV